MILHPSSKMSRLKPLHLGVLWGFQNKIAYSKPTDLGAMGCEILCFRGRMVSRILGHFPTEAFQIILSPGLLSLLTSLFCTYYMGPVLLSDYTFWGVFKGCGIRYSLKAGLIFRSARSAVLLWTRHPICMFFKSGKVFCWKNTTLSQCNSLLKRDWWSWKKLR